MRDRAFGRLRAVQAARLVIEARFGGIEPHAVNGDLLELVLNADRVAMGETLLNVTQAPAQAMRGISGCAGSAAGANRPGLPLRRPSCPGAL